MDRLGKISGQMAESRKFFRFRQQQTALYISSNFFLSPFRVRSNHIPTPSHVVKQHFHHNIHLRIFFANLKGMKKFLIADFARMKVTRDLVYVHTDNAKFLTNLDQLLYAFVKSPSDRVPLFSDSLANIWQLHQRIANCRLPPMPSVAGMSSPSFARLLSAYNWSRFFLSASPNELCFYWSEVKRAYARFQYPW